MSNQRVLLVSAIVLAGAVGGCGSHQKTIPKSDSEQKQPPQPAPTTLPPPPQPGRSMRGTEPARATSVGASTSRAASQIRFGIKPGNYDDTDPGVVVEDVYSGTSAADAGIKADDRLMTWNGKVIHDVREWMQYMQGQKPGDVVEVGVLREGKTVPIRVTLKARED